MEFVSRDGQAVHIEIPHVHGDFPKRLHRIEHDARPGRLCTDDLGQCTDVVYTAHLVIGQHEHDDARVGAQGFTQRRRRHAALGISRHDLGGPSAVARQPGRRLTDTRMGDIGVHDVAWRRARKTVNGQANGLGSA